MVRPMPTDEWPDLPLAAWRDTRDTLHMWTQMVGKVRLALAPAANHWWHVTLYPTARGLTTSPMPYRDDALEIAFDFVDHRLRIETGSGRIETLPLTAQTVADFYAAFTTTLARMGVEVTIWPVPVEVPDPIPFARDTTHRAYDPEWANRWWRVLARTVPILQAFRGRFVGKCSPVHFFWGSFDLAVTRFSGRPAPPRPDADPITRAAYSHEVISAGFWPGGGAVDDAAFYAYAAPEPAGFRSAAVLPAQAAYDTSLGEYILLYDVVRRAPSPERMLLEFLQSTYEAGATAGRWPRAELEAEVK